MSCTVGDYLFWRLSALGVRYVISHNRSSLFIGSIQRNRLLHVDSTRTQLAPSNTEIGAFSVSSTAADVVACYEDGRRLFSWRPVVFIAELPSAQFMNTSEATANLAFAAATIINSPATAEAQIGRVLDVMLYENKPVYIGVSLAVAGQIMVPSSSTQSPAAYGSPRGHSNQGQNGGSADAAVAMGFMR